MTPSSQGLEPPGIPGGSGAACNTRRNCAAAVQHTEAPHPGRPTKIPVSLAILLVHRDAFAHGNIPRRPFVGRELLADTGAGYCKLNSISFDGAYPSWLSTGRRVRAPDCRKNPVRKKYICVQTVEPSGA